MTFTGGCIYIKYLARISIRTMMLSKKILFILIAFVSVLFFSLVVISKIHSLLIEQISRSNMGHVRIYNGKYFSSDLLDRKKFVIKNYKEVMYTLSLDKKLKERISDYSAQIEFTGIITNTIANKSIFFSGLGIEPESSIKIGSYDITTLGSDLSSLDDDGITVDDVIFQNLNLNYQSLVSIAIVDSTGELKFFPYKVRGAFKSELNSGGYNIIKFPLITVIKMLKSNSINHINILLKKESDINVVVSEINRISKVNNLNVKSVGHFGYPYHLADKLNKINYSYYFFCFLIVVLTIVFLGGVYSEVFNTIKKDIGRLDVVYLSYSKLVIGLMVFSFFITLFLSLLSIALGLLFWCILQREKESDIFHYERVFYFLDYNLFFIIPVLLMLSSVIISLVLIINYVRFSDVGVYHD